jgi:DUF2934 family protein
MTSDLVTQQTQNSQQEEIAVRAYRLWEARGRPIASPEEDWLGAEEEIRSEQVVLDEVVRARNKRARTNRSTREDGSPPPFSNHSGQL